MKRIVLTLSIMVFAILANAGTYVINYDYPDSSSVIPYNLSNPLSQYLNNKDSLILKGNMTILDISGLGGKYPTVVYIDLSNANIIASKVLNINGGDTTVAGSISDGELPTGFATTDGFRITGLVLPKNLKKIDDYALNNLWIENLIIPEGVTDIGSAITNKCRQLKTITIPSSVINTSHVYAQYSIFFGGPTIARSLDTIYSYTTVPFLADLLYKPNSTITSSILYVPYGTKNAYWDMYKNAITGEVIKTPQMITAYGDCIKELPGVIFTKNNNLELINNLASDTAISNVSITATSNQSWLTITSIKTGDTTIYTYTASANPTTSQRTAIVTLTANGETKTTTIIQPAGSETLSISKNTVNVSDVSSITNLIITSNTYWNAISSESWVTVNYSSGNGDKTININIEPNLDTLSRTAIITIKTAGITKICTIVQSGKDIISYINVVSDNIDVYPNPATSKITINGSNGIVKIFNLTGTLVLSTESSDISVDMLPKGLYIVNINNVSKSLIIK